jgi:hypothetical protein
MAVTGSLTDSSEQDVLALLTFTGKDGKTRALGMGNLTRR